MPAIVDHNSPHVMNLVMYAREIWNTNMKTCTSRGEQTLRLVLSLDKHIGGR